MEELKAFWVSWVWTLLLFCFFVKCEGEPLFCSGSAPIDLMKCHLQGLKK